MTEILDKLKDCVNLGVVPLLGIFILATLLQFLPMEALVKLGVMSIQIKYSAYFGFALLSSGSLLIATALKWIWDNGGRDHLDAYFLRKEAHDLTDDEKEILARFINGKTRSLSLSIKKAAVCGLQKRRFMAPTGNFATSVTTLSIPFTMQRWAWEYLNRNPHLLDIIEVQKEAA